MENLNELHNLSSEAGQGESENQFMKPKPRYKNRGPYKKKQKPEQTTVYQSTSTPPPQPETTTPQQPNPQAMPGIPTKDLLKVPIGIVSDWTGRLIDPKAKMLPEEQTAICESTALVLDKYFSIAIAKYGPEMMCMTVWGMWAFRVHQIIEVKKEAALAEIKARKDFEEMKARREAESQEVKLGGVVKPNAEEEISKVDSLAEVRAVEVVQ